MRFEATHASGNITGPLRTPRNLGGDTKGNIHSDEDAQKLGFRGGLVAGSIHMEMFPPLLQHAFGDDWFENGSLSLMFLKPTINGEAVRAGITEPSSARNTQVTAWVEQEDGTRIAEGTASAGANTEASALRTRDLVRYPPQDVRILADVHEGDLFPETEIQVKPHRQQERREVITEPMDWYWDASASKWGDPLATPATFVDAIREPCNQYMRKIRAGVIGLFGAIEIRNVNGPLMAGRTYTGGGQVLAVGDSPKTEYMWFDTWANDGDTRVAEMRMMLRFVKASSPLHVENPAATAVAE